MIHCIAPIKKTSLCELRSAIPTFSSIAFDKDSPLFAERAFFSLPAFTGIGRCVRCFMAVGALAALWRFEESQFTTKRTLAASHRNTSLYVPYDTYKHIMYMLRWRQTFLSKNRAADTRKSKMRIAQWR